MDNGVHPGGAQCGSSGWQVRSDAGWLQLQTYDDSIQVSVDPTGLDVGTYQATLIVEATGEEGVPPVSIPVTLTIAEQLYRNYLPVIGRNW